MFDDSTTEVPEESSGPPSFPQGPEEIAEELRQIDLELCRRSLLRFTQHTFPDYEVNWHHAVVAKYLEKVLKGKIRRLLILQPPQTGKSELVSRRFPAYALGVRPNVRIIACSYSASLAGDMSRDVQRIMDMPEYRELFPWTRLGTDHDVEVKTRGQFEVVGHRGFYRAAGVGGSITGKSSDIGIIDDPVKNRSEAESKTYRESVWRWYTSTFSTRQFGTGGSIVIALTRWHEDDLAGRLLKLSAANSNADQWTVLSFPAIATAPPSEIDPREPGQPLWPSKYPLEELNRRRVSMGSYDWAALYQQAPAPPGGGLFKREWFEIVDAVPAAARSNCCRAWDKAGSDASDSDYTCGVRMSECGGIFYVEDVVRAQLSAGARNGLIKQTAMLDGPSVRIRFEQEPGSGGKESAEISIRELAGFDVRAKPSTGDKVTRARPLIAQCEARNVKLVAGDWNGEYLDELCLFPYGTHDDQVDPSAMAFNELALSKMKFAGTWGR